LFFLRDFFASSRLRGLCQIANSRPHKHLGRLLKNPNFRQNLADISADGGTIQMA
jgi:hypothetical protein